jgi:predicted TPR repeat methyltransferase
MGNMTLSSYNERSFNMAKSFYDQDLKSEGLRRTFNAKSNDELCDLYNKWADTYEQELNSYGWNAPSQIALMMEKYVQDRKAPIFEIGIGPGNLGAFLRFELGYEVIDGVDISAKMVELSRRRGVFRNFFTEDCSKGYTFLGNLQYKAVFLCGVFCRGHLDASWLYHIAPYVEKGGYLIFTCSPANYVERNVAEHFEKLRSTYTLIDKSEIFKGFEHESEKPDNQIFVLEKILF